MLRWAFVAALAFGGGVVAWAEESPKVPGKLDAVTVYRGQALVTRVLDVPGPAGLKEIIVTNLPERVVPGSIYAESAEGVEVRSVRFRTQAVPQDVREEVRKLDDKIRDLQDSLAANQRETQLAGERKQYLDKLESFAAPTASVELTKGVLNAETLKALTLFMFDQRQALATDELKLAKDRRTVKEQLDLAQRQHGELTGPSSRSIPEAVVFVNLQNNGGHLRIRYLVDSATWSPSYSARADADGKKVQIEYNASIQQMSGEDWTDVAMTLSTATPSLIATAPRIEPLSIALAPAAAQPVASGYAQQRQQIRLKQEAAFNGRNSNSHPEGNVLYGDGSTAAMPQSFASDADINAAASELQVLELVAKDAKARDRAAPESSETVSVTYQLPARTSLPSRADQQIIQIASLPMKGEFYKLAMPVLTSYVYDQAKVVNEGKTVLLAGPVSSYLGGQFVGVGEIPTVATGETLTLGFGIDSSLRAGRELLEKTDTVQGGNRVLNFSYRLSLENFGPSAASVRLLDRLPTSKESEVRVTLAPGGREPSNDPGQGADRKKGILRWDVSVPPQAMGPSAAVIDYQFRVEYDKQMSIAGLPVVR